MKRLIGLWCALAACLFLAACGGSGSGTSNGGGGGGGGTVARTVSFKLNWAAGAGTAESARISLYTGTSALATIVVNRGTVNASAVVPDAGVAGLRLHAEGFAAAGAAGASTGEVDLALPLSVLGASEAVLLSTSAAVTYEIEAATGGKRVGETIDLYAVPRDAAGNYCLAPEPDWNLDSTVGASLVMQTLAIQPPTKSEPVGTSRFGRLSRSTPGASQVIVGTGPSTSTWTSFFESFDIPSEATWEGTWTGILEDGREGFPGETLYTTIIGKPVGGKYPITWINSSYEPYIFAYEAILEGASLTAFARTVTLTRDGESLLVEEPTAEQIARLRRTNRAVSFKAKIAAARRLASGNLEVDVILTNESASTLTGIQLQNIRLEQFSTIPGVGSSGWPNSSNFGTLASRASARRTLTFSSAVPTGISRLGFGISTEQGLANSIELRVSVPPSSP